LFPNSKQTQKKLTQLYTPLPAKAGTEFVFCQSKKIAEQRETYTLPSEANATSNKKATCNYFIVLNLIIVFIFRTVLTAPQKSEQAQKKQSSPLAKGSRIRVFASAKSE